MPKCRYHLNILNINTETSQTGNFAMADGKQGGIQSIFKLSNRPQCDIVQKHDQTIDLEPEGLSTHVYVAECTNCQLVLKQKAAKVLIEKCQDLVLTMSTELVSGTLEVVKSSKITIKINTKIKVRLSLSGKWVIKLFFSCILV